MNVWQRLKQLAGRAKPVPLVPGGRPATGKRGGAKRSANGRRSKSASAFLNERAGKRRDVYRFDPDALKPLLLNRIEQSRRAAASG